MALPDSQKSPLIRYVDSLLDQGLDLPEIRKGARKTLAHRPETLAEVENYLTAIEVARATPAPVDRQALAGWLGQLWDAGWSLDRIRTWIGRFRRADQEYARLLIDRAEQFQVHAPTPTPKALAAPGVPVATIAQEAIEKPPKLYDWQNLRPRGDRFTHVAVLGGTNDGKTTLVDWLLTFQPGKRKILTTKRKPSQWKACDVVGPVRDFRALDAAWSDALRAMDARLADLGEVEQKWGYFQLVCDELPDLSLIHI